MRLCIEAQPLPGRQLLVLSRAQTYRWKVSPCRKPPREVWKITLGVCMETANFFGTAQGCPQTRKTIETNPPFCDDDNKLNFHLLFIYIIYTESQMTKQ